MKRKNNYVKGTTWVQCVRAFHFRFTICRTPTTGHRPLPSYAAKILKIKSNTFWRRNTVRGQHLCPCNCPLHAGLPPLRLLKINFFQYKQNSEREYELRRKAENELEAYEKTLKELELKMELMGKERDKESSKVQEYAHDFFSAWFTKNLLFRISAQKRGRSYPKHPDQ